MCKFFSDSWLLQQFKVDSISHFVIKEGMARNMTWYLGSRYTIDSSNYSWLQSKCVKGYNKSDKLLYYQHLSELPCNHRDAK